MLGDSFSDADHQGDLSRDGLLDTSGSERGAIQVFRQHRPSYRLYPFALRDKDRRRSRSGLLHGIRNVAKDWQAEVGLAGLLGICSANNVGSYQRYAIRLGSMPKIRTRGWSGQ